MKQVTTGARSLQKATNGASGASKTAQQALQRSTRNTASGAAKTTGKTGGTVAKPGTATGTGAKTGKKFPKTYKRPSGYRKGVRDTVWSNAQKASKDGKVRDPLTNKVMSKKNPWDMGHKPGYEFHKHRDSAARRKISRKQFLDEHNQPDHYVPELPSSNQSHQGEDHTSQYFGP